MLLFATLSGCAGIQTGKIHCQASITITGNGGVKPEGVCDFTFHFNPLQNALLKQGLRSALASGYIDFSDSNIAIPNNTVSAVVKLFSADRLVASRTFAFGILNEIMVPLDPQAIADWAGAVSFDRFTVNFATIPAAIQTGVNVAVATAVLDDTIVAVVSDAAFCETGVGGNFQCQDQLGQY